MYYCRQFQISIWFIPFRAVYITNNFSFIPSRAVLCDKYSKPLSLALPNAMEASPRCHDHRNVLSGAGCLCVCVSVCAASLYKCMCTCTQHGSFSITPLFTCAPDMQMIRARLTRAHFGLTAHMFIYIYIYTLPVLDIPCT